MRTLGREGEHDPGLVHILILSIDCAFIEENAYNVNMQ